MSMTILIADDEELECDAFEFLVSKTEFEFTCIKARNGREAVEKARESRPQIIVLDIQMPVMNGLEAAEEIRKFLPDAIIIFLTAFGRFDFAQKALRLMATDYLVKPIDEDAVNNLIHKCMKKIEDSNEQKPENSKNTIIINTQIQKSGENLRNAITDGQIQDVLECEQKLLEKVYETYGRTEKAAESISTLLMFLNYSIGERIPFLQPPQTEFKNLMEQEQQLASFCLNAVNAAIQDRKDKYERTFNLIFAYIAWHFMEDLDTEKLCHIFSIHTGYFPQLFKKYAGCTFVDYLTEIRLKNAVSELNSGKSVKESAKNSGFTDNNYFSKVFKKHFGVSPTEFLQNPSQKSTSL